MKTELEMSCLVDGCMGIYVPKSFIECFNPDDWGISKEDADILLEGPDAEYYWECWDDVLENANYTDKDGVTWTLYQDGDLFAVPEGYNWE